MFKQVVTLGCLLLISASQMHAQQNEVNAAARQLTEAAVSSAPNDRGKAKNVIKIPRRAGLKFTTLLPLNSATAKVGNEIPLRLVSPLVVNNVTVLPADAVVNARVTQVKRANKCKPGKVEWKLDRIIFPDSSTAKTRIWSYTPGDLEVPPRLFNEFQGGEGFDLPEINEWWEVPLALPLYAFVIVCYSPLIAIAAVLLPFSLGADSCTAPGKEYDLPAGSAVAVMITESHTVRY